MPGQSRRSFLKTATGCAALAVLPSPAFAQSKPLATSVIDLHGERRLYIKVQHSGEIFDGTFRNDVFANTGALAQIDILMRDWRRDEVVQIDRSLIDLLANVQSQIGYHEPLTLISCYRSRKTNEMLRRRSRAVAKNSYHVKGMAVDLRIDGVSTKKLRNISRPFKAGGIGYYPRKNFVHLDTGPLRSWVG